MSPTTLYREGTDLDGLLAELDSRYPGQVRVVEVTRPREGGVLGFFAKQRIGVHYRLIDDAEMFSTAQAFDGGSSRTPGNDAAAGARAAESLGYDAARGAGPVAPTRPGLFQDGFGPDPAAIRAALARRAPAAAEARPNRPETVAGHVGAADAAAVSDGAAAPGMAFARILADLALKKASVSSPASGVAASAPEATTATSTGPSSPASPQPHTESTSVAAPGVERRAATAGAAAPSTLGVSDDRAAWVPADVSVAAQTFAAMDFAALTPLDLTTAGSRAAVAAALAADAVPHAVVGTAAPTGDSCPAAVSAPAITLRRRSPRAVPQSQTQPDVAAASKAVAPGAEPAHAVEAAAVCQATSVAEPTPAVTLAFTDLPRVDASGATPARSVDAMVSTATPAARPGALSWPLAATARSVASATAVLERPAGPDGEAQTAEGASMRNASYELDDSAAARSSTPLTLRRKLLEVGVPVDRVPTDSVHAYAAIEELVSGLEPAGELPSAAGQVLVVAGPARDAVAAADSVIAGNPGVFATTWTYGCAAALSTRRISTTANVIASAQQAGDVASAARESAEGPVLVVVSTDTAGKTAPEVIDALRGDAVWAAVDATRKPSDTRRALRVLPQPDAIVVANAERSTSPATVWELGLPIALVDGRPSTGPAWAVLLLGKLSELEESECSAALC